MEIEIYGQKKLEDKIVRLKLQVSKYTPNAIVIVACNEKGVQKDGGVIAEISEKGLRRTNGFLGYGLAKCGSVINLNEK